MYLYTFTKKKKICILVDADNLKMIKYWLINQPGTIYLSLAKHFSQFHQNK